MIVKVLQHHIDEGEPHSILACPVALALKEETGDDWAVYLNGAVRRGMVIGMQADGLTEFVQAFDNYISVEPLELDFAVVDFNDDGGLDFTDFNDDGTVEQ